jgi:hypothetical protein
VACPGHDDFGQLRWSRLDPTNIDPLGREKRAAAYEDLLSIELAGDALPGRVLELLGSTGGDPLGVGAIQDGLSNGVLGASLRSGGSNHGEARDCNHEERGVARE